jgi:cellulose synthase/poly-beta-1,6-N-acetylglucosamine synthase-like glycosyltransferase
MFERRRADEAGLRYWVVSRQVATAWPFLSVLIPAYNEEAGLASCVDLVLAKLSGAEGSPSDESTN